MRLHDRASSSVTLVPTKRTSQKGANAAADLEIVPQRGCAGERLSSPPLGCCRRPPISFGPGLLSVGFWPPSGASPSRGRDDPSCRISDAPAKIRKGACVRVCVCETRAQTRRGVCFFGWGPTDRFGCNNLITTLFSHFPPFTAHKHTASLVVAGPYRSLPLVGWETEATGAIDRPGRASSMEPIAPPPPPPPAPPSGGGDPAPPASSRASTPLPPHPRSSEDCSPLALLR